MSKAIFISEAGTVRLEGMPADLVQQVVDHLDYVEAFTHGKVECHFANSVVKVYVNPSLRHRDKDEKKS